MPFCLFLPLFVSRWASSISYSDDVQHNTSHIIECTLDMSVSTGLERAELFFLFFFVDIFFITYLRVPVYLAYRSVS